MDFLERKLVPRRLSIRWLIVFLVSLCYLPEAFAQTPEIQYPALLNGFEIEAGYPLHGPDDEDAGFYKITYKGSQVKEEGTPFKSATHFELTSPVSEVATGDRNSLSLRLEEGITTVGGTLFELDGVKPISFRGINSDYIRGNAYVSGNSESLRYAAGLETSPFRIPGLSNSKWSNWAVFGVNAQRTENSGLMTQKAEGLLTYRLFAGRAFGWRKSADRIAIANKLEDELLKLAPTYEDASLAVTKINTIAGTKSVLQQLFLDAYNDYDAAIASWSQTVKDLVSGHADAITDQPTVSVYLENSGWYDFDTDSGEDDLKNLLTATIDYWFMPQHDDVFLRLRYEYGYERATPDEKKDQLMLLLTLKF